MKPHQTVRFVLVAAALSTIVFSLLGCNGGGSGGSSTGSTSGGSISLTGAGSSFVNPAMSKWTYSYGQAHPDVTVNYQSVGSGAGIAQYQAGNVDFGATDAPLTDSDLASMPKPTVQFPVVSGCEVLVYNLPGIGDGLKLSGDVIADIFLGTIKAWNDPRIVAQNPGLKLPSTPINVAHRSDASGTTFIFSDYLSAVSPTWKSGPGQGKTVNWPVGVGGKGNEGVAGLVKETPGSIGYVELAYAVQAKLTHGPIRNKDGNYVLPSIEGTTAAVEAAADALKKDNRASIVNQAGKDVYPIAGMTYVMITTAPQDKAKAAALNKFFKWVLADGQAQAKDLQYAPLPAAITALNDATLDSVQTK
ncbi:MAG: phosphate ABC transporter substrate-binding protein PstS [Fimbriimonadaceae bacterium]